MTIYVQDRIPYTYLIGWSQLDRWYYGVRYGKGCKPDDLWKIYFTSSPKVKAFRELHGEPDIISVRRIFECKDKARVWEHKVLRRMKVVKSSVWLNQSDLISQSTKGYKHTEESRAKMSASRRGSKRSEETKLKMSLAAKGKSKNLSVEAKQKLSEHFKRINSNKPKSIETKKKMSSAAKGVKKTEEHKKNVSLGLYRYFESQRVLSIESL